VERGQSLEVQIRDSRVVAENRLRYGRFAMSIWTILSWVFVAILTGINIFVFLKLKGASEQMLKMAFPGAKDMGEALSQMQQMMGAFGGGAGGRPGAAGANPFAALGALKGGLPGGLPGAKGGPAANPDAQLKAAMDMLKKMQQQGKGGPRR
jgi:hypothetical protein